MKFLTYFFCRRSRERKKFHVKLRQAQCKLNRELDLEKFIKRQRMLTTAVLGLLNHEQAFYASKMTQLVVYDDEKTDMNEKSDSYSESDSNQVGQERTNESFYKNKIAKDLIDSSDKVDKRMLYLHKIVEKTNKKTDLIDFLDRKNSISDIAYRSAQK